MGIKALKEAVEKFQTLYDFLGEFGGIIKTKNPDTWWELGLQITPYGGCDRRKVLLGIYEEVYGDVRYDPIFSFLMTLNEGKVADIDLLSYTSETLMGEFEIDENDVMHHEGTEEENAGMSDRFLSFLTNIVDVGPYLRDPEYVEKFTEPI